MAERIGMVGLGVMGSAMAANLIEAGFEVVGYDISEERRAEASSMGVAVTASASDVARSTEKIFFSLPTVTALEDVTSELAVLDGDGKICIETGTLPLDAKESAATTLLRAGFDLMDVPLSGTGLQAADATLVVFASGSEESFRRIEPALAAIGRSTHYLGAFGNGSRMKYIANLLVAVNTLAAAEAHALGIAAGMSPALVQEVMEDGVGSSKMLEIRGPMMVADDYPAAARLDIILKDATLIGEFARQTGAPTPLLDTAVGVYQDASATDLGDLDAAALCRHLERIGGLTR